MDEDARKWWDYFWITADEDGNYYFSWYGTRNNAFPDKCWRSIDNMKKWINENWRQILDEEFEKEVLGET
jgi:hypothetical protein